MTNGEKKEFDAGIIKWKRAVDITRINDPSKLVNLRSSQAPAPPKT